MKENTQTILADIHMLATENAVFPYCLWLGRISGQLHLDKSYPEGKVNSMLPQFLYATTDEEIKEGDWYINTWGGTIDVMKCTSKKEEHEIATIHSCKNTSKKIVATTNQSLWYKEASKIPDTLVTEMYFDNSFDERMGIAKIDTTFLQPYVDTYNAGKPIKQVRLETEVVFLPINAFPSNQKHVVRLKLKPNGSCIIQPVVERMYSREDVERILWSGCEQAKINQELNKRFISKEWFETNYPQ